MIRELTADELPLLCPIGHAFYKEGNIPGRFVDEVFLRNATAMLKAGTSRYFAAFKGPMPLIGALGCMVYNDIYDGEKVSVESFWYVFPQHRGVGLKLMLHYQNWAKENGVKRIMMGSIAGLGDSALHDLYIKMGYRKLETLYTKNL